MEESTNGNERTNGMINSSDSELDCCANCSVVGVTDGLARVFICTWCGERAVECSGCLAYNLGHEWGPTQLCATCSCEDDERVKDAVAAARPSLGARARVHQGLIRVEGSTAHLVRCPSCDTIIGPVECGVTTSGDAQPLLCWLCAIVAGVVNKEFGSVDINCLRMALEERLAHWRALDWIAYRAGEVDELPSRTAVVEWIRGDAEDEAEQVMLYYRKLHGTQRGVDVSAT